MDTPDPASPPRDQPDNEDFGTTEAVGEGYPEEAPAETVPEGTDKQPKKDQPQRDEG